MVQSQRTKDLIFDVAANRELCESIRDAYAGGVIYTGTPGTTRPIKAGDTVEVEVEGVGVLRNRVVQR